MEPSRPSLQRPLGPSAGLLALLWVAIAFGNSLQPISLFTWLSPLLTLLAYEHLATLKAPLASHATLLLVQALGSTFGLLGMLGYPRTTAASFFATLGFGLFLAAATTFGALLPARRLRLLAMGMAPPGTSAAPTGLRAAAAVMLHLLPLYAFPILYTATLTLTGTVLGRMHDPGVSLLDWAVVVQVGMHGIRRGACSRPPCAQPQLCMRACGNACASYVVTRKEAASLRLAHTHAAAINTCN